MKVILTSFGTGGDVDPHIGIGQVLKSRGHDVVILTQGPFEPTITAAGLQFAGLGTDEAYEAFLHSPDLWNRKRAPLALGQICGVNLMPTFEHVRALVEPGRTVLVAGTMALGARLAEEALHLPAATIHLQPYGLTGGGEHQRQLSDGVFVPIMNKIRAHLQLPPLESVFEQWRHSPRRVLALFPEWYAPQVERPANTLFTGFPLYDEKGAVDMPAGLEEFLAGGSPPIVFTFGTGLHDHEDLFKVSAEACARLGRRGILLTRDHHLIPETLPEGVRHFEYIPFSEVLGRSALLVHHGGVGTVSQALKAAIPQVVVPFAHDQPDNAQRVVGLGVGATVDPTDFTLDRAVEALQPLLNDPPREKCTAIAARFVGMNGLTQAADAIEALLPVGVS